MCGAGMVVAALQTLVVPVLSDIGDQLHASDAAVSWVVTANLLAAVVLTPLVGRLGDLRGRRAVLIGCLAAMLAGSVLGALTSSLPVLILARVLQGAAGGVFPLALSILRDELPGERLTSAMAVVSGTLGIGGGIGLVLTGVLTQHGADYHRVFWLATAASLLSLLAVLRTVPARAVHVSGRIDWLGAGVLGAGLVALLLALEEGNGWGWTSARTLGCFAAAALILFAWVRLERRVAAPLVDLAMLTHRPILITNVAALFVGLAMFTAFMGVTALAETPRAQAGYGFGASVLTASVVYLLPGALSSVVAAPLGGRLVRTVGGREVLVLASVLAAAGFAMLAVAHDAPWEVIVAGLMVNAAVSLAYAAMPALIVAEVPRSQNGIANSVNSIARSFGMSLGSALIVSVLAGRVLPETGLPSESGFVIAFAIAAAGCTLSAVLVQFGGLPAGRWREERRAGEPLAARS
jgi:MFS family permease